MFPSGYCGAGFVGGPFVGHMVLPMVILALILLSSWLVFTRRVKVDAKKSDGALELLRQRYAAGEIDEKEYLQKKEYLS